MTGYIAGDALCALHKVHPDYEYAALVRTKEKADQVTREYPKVRIVLGGLDDSALLEKESAAADIVLRKCCLVHLKIRSASIAAPFRLSHHLGA